MKEGEWEGIGEGEQEVREREWRRGSGGRGGAGGEGEGMEEGEWRVGGVEEEDEMIKAQRSVEIRKTQFATSSSSHILSNHQQYIHTLTPMVVFLLHSPKLTNTIVHKL